MRHLPVAYPSSQDIRYACWLKHFAAQLPAHRVRYQLDVLSVRQVQCLAVEFIELLVCQLHCTTAFIRQQSLVTDTQREEFAQLADCKQVIQSAIAQVVAHIEQHPAYSVTAGHTLELLFGT